jgi:hypothetical protein
MEYLASDASFAMHFGMAGNADRTEGPGTLMIRQIYEFDIAFAYNHMHNSNNELHLG